MEEAGGLGFDDGQDLLGEAAGPGGGAVLVVDNAQAFVGFADGVAEDGLEEVVAVGAVEPRGAQDGVADAVDVEFALAREFALAVNAGGRRGVGLDPRLGAREPSSRE